MKERYEFIPRKQYIYVLPKRIPSDITWPAKTELYPLELYD